MENYISRAEHEEFRKRMEDENHRQNRRISELEKTSLEIHTMSKSLVVMCEKLTSMNENIDTLNEKVEVIESRDGDSWRKLISHSATVVIGILIGYILKQIGIF